MTSDTKQVVLFIADISGYTRFMLSHATSLRHSQTIIAALLESLMKQVDFPLEIAEVQGDALFIYAIKPEDDGAWKRRSDRLIRRALRLFDSFARRLAEIQAYSICRCDACANMGDLRLKLIVHSGEALFNSVGPFAVLSGVDVITVHRLTKNSVAAREYVLMTESAFADLGAPDGAAVEERYEEYDVGKLKTYVFLPDTVRQFDPEELRQEVTDSNVAVRILRDEIRREYTEVAEDPERGYHFNTGRKAARVLGYDDAWLEGIPDDAIESFAGTGNPLGLGEISKGDHVVDVGSGSGLDSLIAARMTGPHGRVVGVDMTEAMLNKATAGAERMGLDQVEFREGYAEALPLPNDWADVVISNGVLNLSPDKSRVLAEFHRVLRPGGRVHIGDILVERPVPDDARGDIDLWTN